MTNPAHLTAINQWNDRRDQHGAAVHRPAQPIAVNALALAFWQQSPAVNPRLNRVRNNPKNGG